MRPIMRPSVWSARCVAVLSCRNNQKAGENRGVDSTPGMSRRGGSVDGLVSRVQYAWPAHEIQRATVRMQADIAAGQMC